MVFDVVICFFLIMKRLSFYDEMNAIFSVLNADLHEYKF